jgi:O-antigen/teichoic acid export membrane protein
VVLVVLSVASIGQDVGDFGTSQWICRELASGSLHPASARRLLRQRLVLVAAVCIVAGAGAIGVGHLSVLMTCGAAIYVCGAVSNAGMQARLRAEGNFRRSAVHVVVERLSWLCTTVLVLSLMTQMAHQAALIVGAMGLIFGASSLLAPNRALMSRKSPSVGVMYKKAAAFGVMGLATDIQQLDVGAAAYFASAGIAGEVGAASKFTAPVGLVASTMGIVLFRNVAVGGSVASSSVASARRAALAFSGLVLLSIPLVPVAVTLGLGRQYEHARLTVIVYMVGRAVAVLNQLTASILTAQGRERPVTAVVVTAAVLGLGGGVAFLGQLGSVSLGLGFLATQLIVGAGCAALVRRSSGGAVPRPSVLMADVSSV